MPLTEAEEQELAALEALDEVESLAEFIGRADPRYPSPDHVAPIREPFEESRYRETRTLISCPPRHVKTHTIKGGLAYLLTYEPALENTYVSAAAELAEAKSQEIQQIVMGMGGSALGRRSNWRTVYGGRLKAMGVGGQYTGTGATGMQVFDDPYPTSSHALSATYRNKVVLWKEGTADNRCEPGCSRMICHTRFHPDDLIGYLLKTERHRWRYVAMPAVQDFDESAADNELAKAKRRSSLQAEVRQAYLDRGMPIPEQLQPDYDPYEGLIELGVAVPEEDAPDYKSIGRPLWPEYWPMQRLLPFMRHKRWWYAVFQQDPRPEGSRIFYEPARFRLADWRGPGGDLTLLALRIGLGGDPAATPSRSADYSAVVLMGVKGYGNATQAWIFHVERAQERPTDFAQRCLRLQRKFRAKVYMEAVGGFKAVPDAMRLIGKLGGQKWRCPEHGLQGSEDGRCPTCRVDLVPDTGALRIEEVPALGSKFMRAQGFAAAWNDGRVYVPMDADWADEYIEEVCNFTGLDGDVDDQVDASAHVFNALYKDAPTQPRGRSRLHLPF